MKTVGIVSLLVLPFLAFASPCFSQEKAGPTWHSHARAVRVLESGIDALGGIENGRRADKVTVNYKAVNHPLGQNAAFDAPPADFQRVGAKTLIDYSGNRYVTEGRSNSAGGYQFNFRYVITPRRSFSLDLLRNRRGSEVRNLDERAKSQFKLGLLSEVPHLLLLYVAERTETLRWLGEAEVDGRQFRVVSFAAENGAEVSLYFDARTDLLARTEQLDSHALLGDMRLGHDFSDYRTVGGVKIPRRRLAFANQFVTSENEYADVRLDFADGERLLEVPPGFVESAPRQAAAAPEEMRKMGEGVEELKLDVETLVAVHSGAVAWEAFRRAVADAERPGGAGVLAIAYMDESRVALVDGSTYQTLATLETGKSPHEVRVSPDGRRAYVAAGKTITAVDLKSRTVKATFDLGSYSAHDIRVSRDGRRIWAACAGAQAILELDSETGKTLRTYSTDQPGSWFVEVTPDERKLYTPNLEGKSVSVIDRATGRVKVIRFAHPVYGIDISPDGKEVWVSGRDLVVIDTAVDEVTATVKTPEADTGRIRLSSDGKKLVVALLKKLAVFDAKTRRLMSETELGASPKVLTLSGDGRHAFLTNPADNSVSVVDLVAGRLLTTFRTGKKPDGIGWAN